MSAQYQKRLPQTELHAADVGGRNSRIVIDPDTQVMKEVDGNVMSDPQENKTMVDFSDE